MIKIDKNIPLPSSHSRAMKYPISLLEVGESFAVPIKHRSTIAARISAYSRKHAGYTFATRATEEKGEKVLRVWRTA